MIDRRPKLLIVGGLAIDRFADGTSAPGGAVIHAGRAAVAEGANVTILTIAGDEREAATGLRQLAEMGDLIHQRAPSTVTYGHGDVDGRRVLTFLAGAGPIAPPGLADLPDVALLAPIADELPASAVAAIRDTVRPRSTVLLIQGWLRRLEVGAAVTPLALDEVPAESWAAFAMADAIVVSTEDLADAPGDPFDAVAAVRSRIGPRPLLVLTRGVQGYLLDDPAAAQVVAGVPGRRVEGVSTVGAGDTFGVTLALQLAAGAEPAAAAIAATERVVRLLEGRR
jgi:sugar/nucleoside kinase (ribokinase family)